jgi:hypothetical protein
MSVEVHGACGHLGYGQGVVKLRSQSTVVCVYPRGDVFLILSAGPMRPFEHILMLPIDIPSRANPYQRYSWWLCSQLFAFPPRHAAVDPYSHYCTMHLVSNPDSWSTKLKLHLLRDGHA